MMLVNVAEVRLDGVGRLTARKHDVLELVAAGPSNSGIAARLGLTTRTVETHTRRIFTKLDLDDGGGVHRRVRAALVHQRAHVKASRW
jgi:DNA-binding NarL/FixJ family response regulator